MDMVIPVEYIYVQHTLINGEYEYLFQDAISYNPRHQSAKEAAIHYVVSNYAGDDWKAEGYVDESTPGLYEIGDRVLKKILVGRTLTKTEFDAINKFYP